MAHPLIILGAGASHDFQNLADYEGHNDIFELKDWQPPLTNQLFDVAKFGRIIGNYEHVKPLAATINNLVKNQKNSFDFEKYLSQIQQDYPDNTRTQVMALRFYLAELLNKVSFYHFRHTNNHLHLINEINNRGGNACVVNFNYDTLFEKNISNINLGNNIDDYISGPIKVIKIHGAHNWRYIPKIDSLKRDVYEYFMSDTEIRSDDYREREVFPIVIKRFNYRAIDSFSLNEAYREHKENGFREGQWLYYLPAIAIPIGTKGNFICPKSHIDSLIEQIKETDRILVIGWRAQDEYLLSLLKEHLHDNVKLTIVSNGGLSAQDYVKRFRVVDQIKITDMYFPNQGYTNFMIEGGMERFFA
ncbi:MAG: hypothetical protein ABI758_00415 [Candidatus Woesebacteria bacterium]